MKAREWLVEKGLAKATRGRLSLEAKAALSEAIASGMKFSDYSATEDGKVEKKNDEDVSYDTAPQFHSDSVTFSTATLKKISPASACQMCGYSLRWCAHPVPRVTTKNGTEDVIVSSF